MTDSMINAAANAYAEDIMRQVRKMEIEQTKWHIRHPDEPYVPSGIKVCHIFTKQAFADGARWMKRHYKDIVKKKNDNGNKE